MSEAIGAKLWVLAEGACILNAGGRDAHVRITEFFADRDPAGPYRIDLPARRTCDLRVNDPGDPEPILHGTDYGSILESDQPVVVQHTRLDWRQAENALMTTQAYAAG